MLTPRHAGNKVKKLRDSHHKIARLFAMGLRTSEVAFHTGYSIAHVSNLRGAPQMQDLIAKYQKDVDGEFKDVLHDYYSELNEVRAIALRQIKDQLVAADETGEDLPITNLLKIHDSSADRTGFPKRKENVNFNQDFAARLESAMARAKVINDLSARDGAGVGPPATPVAEPEQAQGVPSYHSVMELLPPPRRRV